MLTRSFLIAMLLTPTLFVASSFTPGLESVASAQSLDSDLVSSLDFFCSYEEETVTIKGEIIGCKAI